MITKSFDQIPITAVAFDKRIFSTAVSDIAKGKSPDMIRDYIVHMTAKKPELLKSSLVRAALWLVS